MGIGVKMTARVTEVKGDLTVTLQKAINRIFREAIKAYARAVFVNVSVDIGQARSSVLPAGRIVRAALGNVSGRSPKKWEKKSRPGYPFGRTKTAGVRQGQATMDIVDGQLYNFSWTTTVQHFPLSQAGGIPAIEAGRAAYRRVVAEGFASLNKVIASSFRTTVLRS